jgi:transposase
MLNCLSRASRVMPLPPELPITEEDWNRTPPAVQAVVIALWQQVQALQAQVAALQAEVAQLREQVGRNSQNSSQPPSSDAPSASPRPKRAPSGRKPGGQLGHTGHGRKLVLVEQVQRVLDLKPTECDQCGALLMGEDVQPVRRQVTELPRVEPEVTEYRQHTLTCLACGAQTRAEFPAEMPSGSFGPRVQATVGYLTGRIGVSQRDVEEVLQTVFHTDISLGSIPRVRSVRTDYAAPNGRALKNVTSQRTDYVLDCVFRQPAQTGQIERKTQRTSPCLTNQDWIVV